MIRNEGLPALYRGIYPAVARGLFYGGRLLTAFHIPPLLLVAVLESCYTLPISMQIEDHCQKASSLVKYTCTMAILIVQGSDLDATALPRLFWATQRRTSLLCETLQPAP